MLYGHNYKKRDSLFFLILLQENKTGEVNPHRSPPLVINDPGISLCWLSEATDDKDREN